MSRYPLADLLEATGLSIALMAEHLRMNHTQNLYRLKREGLSFHQAEKYAVRLGLVPELVWPAWREESNALAEKMEENERQAAEERREARRARDRARHAANPDRKRTSARKYYEECGDYKRAQVRAWHHANKDRANAQRRARYQANAERERAARRERWAQKKAS